MISRPTALVPVFLAFVAALCGARPSQAQTYLGLDLTPGTAKVPNFATSIFEGLVGGGLGVPDPNIAGGGDHAVIWTGASRYTNLTPNGEVDAYVSGLAAGQQVGQESIPANSFYPHAFLWAGTAASAVDLNPAGFFTSLALATDGVHQVGNGNIGTSPANTQWEHALLWCGSAASSVDLNPANYQSSNATALSGNQQVGFGQQVVMGGPNHALLWSGTAASASDLNPSGFSWSEADGIHGSQIVGWGTPGNAAVAAALLWNGSADSYVNLSPAGFTRAYARATNGRQQVGEVGNDVNETRGRHAALWTGTAASYIDLNRFLPPGFVSAAALAIDDEGNVAGYGFDSAGIEHALEWLAPIPGDINGDRRVDFTDLLTLAQHYGMTPATWAGGDFNGDGAVNFDDLLLLAQHYGQSPSPAQLAQFNPATRAEVEQAFTQVPEPAALIPFAFSAALSVSALRSRR